MPLYYGIIVPNELFWKSLAESYLERNNIKKWIFDNPISEYLYQLQLEYGEEELTDEGITEIENKALEILETDEWNLVDEIFDDMISLYLPNNLLFFGNVLNTQGHILYSLDNLESKESEKVDKYFKKNGLSQFNPRFFYSDKLLYSGSEIIRIKGLENKNKM
jgi:hypothetical protein